MRCECEYKKVYYNVICWAQTLYEITATVRNDMNVASLQIDLFAHTGMSLNL